MENNNFYVYEHIRLDDMTCFYVGKGTGRRCNQLSRNEHHDRISKKYGHAVVIIADNLTEEEAFEIERETIEDYVFNLGYGIDIIGYNNEKDEIGHLTNNTFGGDGTSGRRHTEEEKLNQSIRMTGKNNPMYGISLKMSDENKKIMSERNKGEKNPMYGISPKDRMSEEVYNNWRYNRKDNSGENNPNYGNKWSEEKRRHLSEFRKGKYVGEDNPHSKTIQVYNLDGELINEFTMLQKCAKWLISELNLTSKYTSVQQNISTSIKKNKPYRKLIFKYK